MITTALRNPFLAVTMLACIVAAPLRADSLWLGEGTLFRLQAQGTARTLLVELPSRQAAAFGLQPGTIVFEGKRTGKAYSGTFFDCKAGGISVNGRVVDEVSVVFDAPEGEECDGLLASGLALRFTERASTIADDADIGAIGSRQNETTETTTATGLEGEPSGPTVAAAPLPAQPEIPAKACQPVVAAQNINLAGCRGLLSGLRITEGASPEAEAGRETRIASASGASDLQRAVDAACYPSAELATFADGLDLARTQTARAETLRPVCIDALASSERVSSVDRIALSGGDGIAAQVWAAEQGVSCRGHNVLRLTPAGIFEGRYGAETVAPNATVSDWKDDGTTIKATVAVHSELVTAPDVVLLISATRSGNSLSVEVIREQVTPNSRYTRTPKYESSRNSGIWYPCAP